MPFCPPAYLRNPIIIQPARLYLFPLQIDRVLGGLDSVLLLYFNLVIKLLIFCTLYRPVENAGNMSNPARVILLVGKGYVYELQI